MSPEVIGFQGASIDRILARAGVAKGRVFHHFATKAEFGYALVDDVRAGMIAAQWVAPLREPADPLEAIAAEFERGVDALCAHRPILGCPLNNLAQEMNPLDAGFRHRTSAVFDMWRDRLPPRSTVPVPTASSPATSIPATPRTRSWRRSRAR